MGFALPKSSSLVLRESSTTITSAHRQPAIPAQREYRPIDAALAITQTVCMVIPAKNEARNLPIVFSFPARLDRRGRAGGRALGRRRGRHSVTACGAPGAEAAQMPETDLALPVSETDLVLPAVAVAADMSKD
jgi:hypothetical protein